MLELSKIVTAVKPKDRTDQYKILAALYCLNAHMAPVATKQVADLLALHFANKDRPSNLTTSLKSYQAYVDPAEKSPRWKWQLTQTGLDRLRMLSGLALASPSLASDFDKDMVVLCALETPELVAVFKGFGGDSAWKDIGDAKYAHVCRECSLRVASGRTISVVATAASSMGLTAAAIATTQLVVRFRPRFVAMVGIAAGTQSGGKQFGDVLVADPSVDYNSGKVVSVNGVRKFQPDPYPIGLHPHLRTVLKTYLGSPSVFSQIRYRWKGQVPKGQNQLHLGPLGAADQVIDDASRLVEIQDHWRKLIGIEMETYGVYRACLEAPEPKPRFASFKSVCDFAALKSDAWQEYAAFTAAEFTAEFIRAKWDTLWPTANGNTNANQVNPART